MCLYIGFMHEWQIGIIVNPPDSDMRIKHNHVVASQSDAAIGSVGLIYVTGVPCNG